MSVEIAYHNQNASINNAIKKISLCTTTHVKQKIGDY